MMRPTCGPGAAAGEARPWLFLRGGEFHREFRLGESARVIEVFKPAGFSDRFEGIAAFGLEGGRGIGIGATVAAML